MHTPVRQLRVVCGLTIFYCLGITQIAPASEPVAVDTSHGDRLLASYFEQQTRELERACLADIKTKADWLAKRGEYREQLFEMLGLQPRPPKTDLKAQIVGTAEHADFTVEKLHFQSLPNLYVTGNLYVPKKREGRLPAILYVCGHARVTENGVSFGNKTAYQHHGGWFARNGYVCLTIDTVQLGEIPGIHHGTYREGMWWWNARGYSPAGVEAWNCIRALDYLETRPEVDASRFGVTGRSGGGAYSWWIAALDDRIKAAVPVAGITSLRNHVVDGCVEGHCDCMYPLNTFRWDFPLVVALVAPRPLLISNSDKDSIFPLDGVVDVHRKARRIYRLMGADKQLGLQITEGPHRDTQELRVHAFHWFNRFLKGETPLIETAAVKFFTPPELKVFEELPASERTSKIHESFVPRAGQTQVVDRADWKHKQQLWLQQLRERCFRGWPQTPVDLDIRQQFDVTHQGVRMIGVEFTSQQHVRLPLFIALPEKAQVSDLDLIVLNGLDEDQWQSFLQMASAGGFLKELQPYSRSGDRQPDPAAFKELQGMLAAFRWGMAYIPPRGIGPTIWNQNARKQVQIRRRFMLLGQTVDGMRVWDFRRAAQTVRGVPGAADVPLWLQGEGVSAGQMLYAGLFEPQVARVDLHKLPTSHRDGPVFLNIMRFLDLPQATALLAAQSKVRVYDAEPRDWSFVTSTAKLLEWPKDRFQARTLNSSQK